MSNRKPLPVHTVTADVIDMSHDGRGVVRLNGKTVFVRGALSGEKVEFAYTSQKRKFDEGQVRQIIQPSSDRVTPECAHFGVCGGCSVQHQSPSSQIAVKQTVLLENLKRIAGLDVPHVLAPLTGDPWAYRRRARLSVRYIRSRDRVVVGFREANGRFVTDIDSCPVLVPTLDRLIKPLAVLVSGLAARQHIPQFELSAGDGQVSVLMRHLRTLYADDLERLKVFASEHSVQFYLQSGNLDTLDPLSPDYPALTTALVDQNLVYEFTAVDFIQVNAQINQAMVNQALRLLAPQSTECGLDLFCGLGNFSLPLAQKAGQVVGVEGNAGLIKRADANASRNGIENVDFQVADLRKNQRRASWLRDDYAFALIDPPRSGALEILPQLLELSPQRILYVSCHPGSLARDAEILVGGNGYRLTQAGVMDMFPHTSHVESMALFEKSV